MALLHIAGKTLLELVIEQFEDLLVRILLLAACISFVSMISFFFYIFPRGLYGSDIFQCMLPVHTEIILSC